MRMIVCVVDLKQPLNGWCKPLIVINILSSPLLLLDFSTSYPYFTHALIGASVVLAGLVVVMAHLNKAPVMHWVSELLSLISILQCRFISYILIYLHSYSPYMVSYSPQYFTMSSAGSFKV